MSWTARTGIVCCALYLAFALAVAVWLERRGVDEQIRQEESEGTT